MDMRKVLAVLVVILVMCSVCEADEKFAAFPTLGICTGTSVRYREKPDTDSKILGMLNIPDRIVVLGQKEADGGVWYEIEDPKADKKGFVFGTYISPVFDETSQKKETVKMLVKILQQYGITPEKGKSYSGPEVKKDYNHNDFLAEVYADGKGCSFGDIHIGDTAAKLQEILGSPDVKNISEWEYRIGINTILSFRFKDNKITRMMYKE